MTSDLVFPEPAEPRTRPLGWVEPAVHWFTESTRPEAITARETVNGWYDEMDVSDGQFAARLHSEVDVDFYQALDELYVHHLLKQSNDDIRYEEGDIGPDFRIYEHGECVAGVEVLSLFQQKEWTDTQRQHARFADELSARVAPDAGYFVDIRIEEAPHDPPPRRFAHFIRKEIEKLPPYQENQLPPNATGADLPTALYEEGGVRIGVRFLPMRPGADSISDPDARIVGTGAAVGGVLMTAARLRDRIEAKAGGRYDIADVPFAVVAAIHDGFGDDHEVINAIYGSEAVIVPTGARIQAARLIRTNDGLFGTDQDRPDGRHRRVAAVVVINGIPLWENAAHDIALVRNPNAARAWPDDRLPPMRETACEMFEY